MIYRQSSYMVYQYCKSSYMIYRQLDKVVISELDMNSVVLSFGILMLIQVNSMNLVRHTTIHRNASRAHVCWQSFCAPLNKKKKGRGWTSIRIVFGHPHIATRATHPAQCLTQNTKGGSRQNRKSWCREGLFFWAILIDVRFGMLLFFGVGRFFGFSDLDIGPELLSRDEKSRDAKNGKRF